MTESERLDKIAAALHAAADVRASDECDDLDLACRVHAARALRAVQLVVECRRNTRTIFSKPRTLATVKV